MFEQLIWGNRAAWEIHFRKADDVRANMTEFAIGSISALVSRNPRIPLQGTVSHLGSRLKIHRPYAVALCVGIAGVHLALFASTVLTTRRVISKDDSNLSTARLLRPVVDTLGSGGTLLMGKKMGEVIQSNGVAGFVYGARPGDDTNKYTLDISCEVPVLGNKRHPDGTYL